MLGAGAQAWSLRRSGLLAGWPIVSKSRLPQSTVLSLGGCDTTKEVGSIKKKSPSHKRCLALGLMPGVHMDSGQRASTQ